jgi:hypothetical protein
MVDNLLGFDQMDRRCRQLTEANEDLSLPTVSVSSLNSDQEYAFNIIMKTLLHPCHMLSVNVCKN